MSPALEPKVLCVVCSKELTFKPPPSKHLVILTSLLIYRFGQSCPGSAILELLASCVQPGSLSLRTVSGWEGNSAMLIFWFDTQYVYPVI